MEGECGGLDLGPSILTGSVAGGEERGKGGEERGKGGKGNGRAEKGRGDGWREGEKKGRMIAGLDMMH